jgi:hypothetical protein
MQIKVIGCGGIGGCLLPILSRFLNFHPMYRDDGNLTITLIDGDSYEPKNQDRQAFDAIGKKSDVTRDTLKSKFNNIVFESQSCFVDDKNVVNLIEDGDIVFLCVDNHTTRKILSDHCEKLDNILLISGGNDFSDGNVQIHWRINGENKTLPIANDRHMEIVDPEDEHPARLLERIKGCDLQLMSEPQLLIANNMASALMLNAFYQFLEEKLGNYDEVYFNCLSSGVRTVGQEKPAVREVA